MLGVVTRTLRELCGGFVLTEALDEVFFGSYSLDGIDIDELEEGQLVEFELYELEMGRTTITRLLSEILDTLKVPDDRSRMEGKGTGSEFEQH
jgi:cold shock CspA family protein